MASSTGGRITDITNWEVLNFLNLKKSTRGAREGSKPLLGKEERARVAAATHSLAAGINAAAALGPVKLTQTTSIEVAQSMALLTRVKEIKWVEKSVIKYLAASPAALQSREIVMNTLRALDDNAEDSVGRGLGLSERDKLQLLNIGATTQVKAWMSLSQNHSITEDISTTIAEGLAALLPSPASTGNDPEVVAAAAAAEAASVPVVEKSSKKKRRQQVDVAAAAANAPLQGEAVAAATTTTTTAVGPAAAAAPHASKRSKK